MTRDWFIANTGDVYELDEAYQELTGHTLWENGFMDNILDDETLDEYINDWLRETDDNWYDIRDILSDIPQGWDLYNYRGITDVTGFDDEDFSYLKAEVLEELDNYDLWDDDEDDLEADEETGAYDISHGDDSVWTGSTREIAKSTMPSEIELSEESGFDDEETDEEGLWNMLATKFEQEGEDYLIFNIEEDTETDSVIDEHDIKIIEEMGMV